MIDMALDKYIPSKRTYPSEIHRAMRYSIFPGGKRFRAILTLASCETVGGKIQQVLPSACAMELIHSYSLVHDDLPAIDDDDYRRHKLSTHRKFGEAVAILTGDALLTQAFFLLAENAKGLSKKSGISSGISDRIMLRIIREAAEAIGSLGMVGGQIVDIRRKKRYTKKEIEYIHTHKTGALIKVSVRVGAILAGAKPSQLKNLTEYGENIGLAFQIADDILDAAHKKEGPNYAVIFGEKASRKKAQKLVNEAKKQVGMFGEKAKILCGIADYIIRNVDIQSCT